MQNFDEDESIGIEKISKDELVDFCIGQISNFKIPRYIVFVNEWPMSSTKVQKFKLKDLDLGDKVFGNKKFLPR